MSGIPRTVALLAAALVLAGVGVHAERAPAEAAWSFDTGG